MVTNFRQERLIKEKRQKVYGALFLIFLIFVLGRGPIFSFFGRVSHLIGFPFWKVSVIAEDNINYATEYAKPKDTLVNEVLELRNTVEENRANAEKMEVLETENKNIKELFGRDNTKNRVLARVLSRPPMQVYDTLIIDIGSLNNVTEGSLVYTKGDYVLGKITRVYDTTSVVTLSSSPGEIYSVIINNKVASSSKDESSNDITFTGIGGGGFISQIPKHLNIATGTPMVISTINPSMIGIITGENIPDSGSLKEVYGSLPFSIRSIDWVSVEIKK